MRDSEKMQSFKKEMFQHFEKAGYKLNSRYHNGYWTMTIPGFDSINSKLLEMVQCALKFLQTKDIVISSLWIRNGYFGMTIKADVHQKVSDVMEFKLDKLKFNLQK